MMMDYDLARDNFVDMGEMMLRMIYQVIYLNFHGIIDEHWMARVSIILHKP